MKHLLSSVFLIFCGFAAAADTVVAARNIRPGMTLLPSDLALVQGTVPGSYGDAAAVIGQEAKVALYAGRAILSEQIGPPATVERNQLVLLVFQTSGGLVIQTEGRSLGRGSEGERIRVMNLSSKSSLFGTIQADGSVHVSH